MLFHATMKSKSRNFSLRMIISMPHITNGSTSCLISGFHIWKSLEYSESFKLVRIWIYLVKLWIYLDKIWIHLVKIWIHQVKIWIYLVKIWNSLYSTVLTLVSMDRINICARDTGPRWRIELCPSLEKRQSGRRYINWLSPFLLPRQKLIWQNLKILVCNDKNNSKLVCM